MSHTYILTLVDKVMYFTGEKAANNVPEKINGSLKKLRLDIKYYSNFTFIIKLGHKLSPMS